MENRYPLSRTIAQVTHKSWPLAQRFLQAVQRYRTPLLAAGALLGASALLVRHKNRQAEQLHPPRGQFIDVDGVRLHYIERGQGQPLVLFHGNGSMAEDLDISGLLNLTAEHYRVIVFDRPGYGYSERPRHRQWTPTEQAQLLHRALQQLGIEQAIVAGHSWGTLVALAMALDYPQSVRSLVLLSGYYYPSIRLDAMVNALLTTPLIGDVLRYTVSPLLSRLIWPVLLRRVFGPPSTPARFSQFPVWLALRPSQLRASATEGKLMIPAAQAFEHRYHELMMPVVIMAGSADRMVSTRYHSERLHAELPHSELKVISGMGHMVYYFAAHDILVAIDTAAAADHAGMPAPPLHTRDHSARSSLH